MLCTCVFALIVVLIVILEIKSQHDSTINVTATKITGLLGNASAKQSKCLTNVNPNCTHVKNRPLEFVDVEYKRNIYFAVRTTTQSYQERLSTLMLTWLQTVHKDDVSSQLISCFMRYSRPSHIQNGWYQHHFISENFGYVKCSLLHCIAICIWLANTFTLFNPILKQYNTVHFHLVALWLLELVATFQLCMLHKIMWKLCNHQIFISDKPRFRHARVCIFCHSN